MTTPLSPHLIRPRAALENAHDDNMACHPPFQATGVYTLPSAGQDGSLQEFELAIVDSERYSGNNRRGHGSFSLGDLQGFITLVQVETDSPQSPSASQRSHGCDQHEHEEVFDNNEGGSNARHVVSDIWHHAFKPGDVLTCGWFGIVAARSAKSGRRPAARKAPMRNGSCFVTLMDDKNIEVAFVGEGIGKIYGGRRNVDRVHEVSSKKSYELKCGDYTLDDLLWR